MPTYSRRCFIIAIITVPFFLCIFGCNTIDNSINPPTESTMAKSSKKAAPAGDVSKIMCLGNSITEGRRGGKGGYRPALHKMLKDEGYNFDFVGRETAGGWEDNGYNADKDHEGVTRDLKQKKLMVNSMEH
jgi:hypothetical protein